MTTPDATNDLELLLAQLDEAQATLLNIVGEATLATRTAPMFHYVDGEMESHGLDAMRTLASMPRILSDSPQGGSYTLLRYDRSVPRPTDESRVCLTVAGMTHIAGWQGAVEMFFSVLRIFDERRRLTPRSPIEVTQTTIIESDLAEILPPDLRQWLSFLDNIVKGEPGVWRNQRIEPTEEKPYWNVDKLIREFSGVSDIRDYLRRIRSIMCPSGQPYAWPQTSVVQSLGAPTSWPRPQMQRRTDGFTLTAESLHPAVWEAASSLWTTGHVQEAVEAVSKAVSAHLQARLGRADLDGQKIVDQAFSLQDPEVGRPRLRLCTQDNPALFKDLHVGAMHFGKGCFSLFRNPSAHGHPIAPSPEEAFEQLAAFSAFLRLVDRAELVSALCETISERILQQDRNPHASK